MYLSTSATRLDRDGDGDGDATISKTEPPDVFPHANSHGGRVWSFIFTMIFGVVNVVD